MPDRVPDRLWGVLAAFVVQLAPSSPAQLLARQAAFAARVARGDVPADLAVFRDQFGSRANVRSSKRMVRQTPAWGHGYVYEDADRGRQDNRDFYRAIQDELPRAWREIGAAGVFGGWDPLAKPAVLEQWRAALPQIEGRLQVLPDVSHFVEEHRPREIADAIATLLSQGRERSGSAALDV